MKKNLFDKLSKILKKQKQINPINNAKASYSGMFSSFYDLKNQYLEGFKQRKGLFKQKKQGQTKQSVQNIIKSIWNKTISQSPRNISTLKSKIQNPTQNPKQNSQSSSSSPLNLLKTKSKMMDSILDGKVKKQFQKVSKIISEKAQDLKDELSSSKQQISKKASEIKKTIGQSSGKTYEKLKESTDVKKNLKRSFDFIFWRITLLLGIIAFCYGMGSAFPKLIKHFIIEHLSKDSDNDKVQSGKSDRNIY